MHLILKLKMLINYNLAIPFSGIYPVEFSDMCLERYIRIFTVAFFIIVKN